MLDKKIFDMSVAHGLITKEGAALIGRKALKTWPGRSKYYYEIRETFGGSWGRVRIIDKPIIKGGKMFMKVLVPGLGILALTANVQADGVVLGTINTMLPVDTHTVDELRQVVSDAYDRRWEAGRNNLVNRAIKSAGGMDDEMRRIYGHSHGDKIDPPTHTKSPSGSTHEHETLYQWLWSLLGIH
ncbi:MAG: hypothetical protein GC162_08460 [Planctomycetes bacterium]|nr:hypothetical protein [Planctomycetota bacterium]